MTPARWYATFCIVLLGVVFVAKLEGWSPWSDTGAPATASGTGRGGGTYLGIHK